jgi:hypothetical protein
MPRSVWTAGQSAAENYFGTKTMSRTLPEKLRMRVTDFPPGSQLDG